MILLLAILALGALYFTGHLQFTFTGITKPLVGLTIFGVNVTLQKPQPKPPQA